MPDDETDDVRASIDGALRDRGDAMRWVPPQERTEANRPPEWATLTWVPGVFSPPTMPRITPPTMPRIVVGFDPARGSDAFVVVTHAMGEMRAAMIEAARPLGAMAHKMHDFMRDHGLIPEEPPTDLRERALWARRNRHTGPAHDPFTHRGMTSDHTHRGSPRPAVRNRPSKRLPPRTP